jgi:ATP-binding cassette, subfamily G (WHITE), member 2, SNQ2
MLLNGKPLRIDFERITGYVEQLDVHNGFLTVREALQYSAKLRQEPEIPLQEKLDYVERVLEVCGVSAKMFKMLTKSLLDDGNDSIR